METLVIAEMWWLIAKLAPMLPSCWRVTKSGKVAHGKDLTVQMSVLSAFEQTVYVTYLLSWKVHEILLQRKH